MPIRRLIMPTRARKTRRPEFRFLAGAFIDINLGRLVPHPSLAHERLLAVPGCHRTLWPGAHVMYLLHSLATQEQALCTKIPSST